MKGLGVRQKLAVTGGTVAKRDPRLDKAVAAYREYAQEQADATIPKVETFADAIKAGDIEAAKQAYALPLRLGERRADRGVLRGHRPQDRHPRQRPGEGPEVDRLARAGEGPLAGQEDRRRAEGPRRWSPT